MRYLKQTLILSSIVFLLANCGEGTNDSSFDTGDTKITISLCSDSNTTIQPNDLLVKDTDGTIVTINHLSDDNKTVCVESGSAHLVRGN